jgi:phosphoserine aminotransferase
MTPAMTSRPFNFSAGPATMPAEVLAQAADEMLDWPDSKGQRCGMGVMEMSHRGKEFLEIYTQAHDTLRELLAIPENFKILFMQGGGLAENAIVPMNLSALRASKTQRGSADFVITGSLSTKPGSIATLALRPLPKKRTFTRFQKPPAGISVTTPATFIFAATRPFTGWSFTPCLTCSL